MRLIWRPALPGESLPSRKETNFIMSMVRQAAPLIFEIWSPASFAFRPEIPGTISKVISPPAVLADLHSDIEKIADLTPYTGRLPHPGGHNSGGEAAFLLGEETAPFLRDALESAARQGIERISLPSFPFELIPLLGPPFSSHKIFASVWEKDIDPFLPLISSFRWSIHDRFVAGKFRETGLSPIEVGPDAGCQGGTLLAYIGPGREVYPCPSWPIPFGRLTVSWDKVWHGAGRAAFLDSLSPNPLCRTCLRWETCRGGCPGLAAALSLADRPDPLCPEQIP